MSESQTASQMFPPQEQIDKLKAYHQGQALKPAHRLYTIGYGNRPWSEFLDALDLELKVKRRGNASRPWAEVLDVRMSPRSWSADYGSRLEENLLYAGYRYLHVATLGNRNYKSSGGPVQLANVLIGMDALTMRLVDDSGPPPVLLCGCRDHTGCHRTYVAHLAAAICEGLTIVHIS